MKIAWGVLAIGLIASGLVVGCGQKPAAPLVEMSKAPKFGSTPELKTMEGFIVGKWGAKSLTDPNVAKQLGIESIAREEADSDVTDYFTFKADKTFVCRLQGFKPKVAGRWALAGNVLSLTFDTFDGKPIAGELAEAKKNEEQGGQASIAAAFIYEGVQHRMGLLNAWTLGDDQKTLKKYEPGASVMMSIGPNTLVRMTTEDKEKE